MHIQIQVMMNGDDDNNDNDNDNDTGLERIVTAKMINTKLYILYEFGENTHNKNRKQLLIPS